jgi:hypothetical protein
MRWDPAQGHQSSAPKPSNGGMPGRQDTGIAGRRQNALLREPDLQLQLQTSYQNPYQLSSATATPFTFGSAGENTPAFHFSSGAVPAQPSPASNNHVRGGSEESLWSGHPDHSHISPSMANGGGITGAAQTLSRQSSTSASQSGGSKSPQTSPEPKSNGKTAASNHRKRKQSDDDEPSSSSKTKGPKKTAHNMIEKRYRTNLNDKIAALRDSVPSLRVMSRSAIGGEDEDDDEDLEGLAPAHKLNKATVLSKATEYIRHLEKRNDRLRNENDSLKSRLNQLEKMAIAGPIIVPSTVTTPNGMPFQDDMFPQTPTSAAMSQPPQGLIPIPENMANLRRVQMQHQASYANSPQSGYPAYSQAQPGSLRGGPQGMVNGGRHGNVMSRLMVGSLAGLMLLEGFSRRERQGDEVEARGLFAIPFDAIGNIFMPGSTVASTASSGIHAFACLRLLLIISSFVYVMMPLLHFKPKPKAKATPIFRLSPAPSLATPVQYRQKAWLTAIQTVWVPRHSFILEVAALLLKTLKLSIRALIGWNCYASLTGTTKEQECARVQAWNIALDAQLTGGDAEISMNRLVLTLLASGTLPSTPARLMLKALHVRILFWEIAKLGYGNWHIIDDLSAKLARRYWNLARKEHNSVNLTQSDKSDESEDLPKHLAALLKLESDDVLVDAIIQRSYNLAWNLSSSESSRTDESMDGVVEDFAIASPLDALAAWWSSFVTNRVLANSLVNVTSEVQDALDEDLNLAIETAPPNSLAMVRALVARAILSTDREEHILRALDSLPIENNPDSPSRSSSPIPTLINVVGENPVPHDVRTALTLAKCLSLASSGNSTARMTAAASVNRYFPSESAFTLLSFTASLRLFEAFSSDTMLLGHSRSGLERAGSAIRIWIGSEASRGAGIGRNARSKVVKNCLTVSKSIMGIADHDYESDAGYVSQSERSGILPAQKSATSLAN